MVLWRTYGDEPAARRAVGAARAAGVPERDILLLRGSAPHDVRREPVGEFAGPVAPDALVGSFGDRRSRRWHGCGSFAGDADRQRQGSFGDADRNVIVTHDGPAEHVHVAGHRDVGRALRRVGVTPDFDALILELLDAGQIVVLVELSDAGPTDVSDALDGAAA